MLSRRLLRPRPCLNNRLSSSPLNTNELLDPPSRYRPAVGRRYLAAQTVDSSLSFDIRDSTASTSRARLLSSEEQPTALNQLLRSIQLRDAGRIVPNFLSWVKSFEDPNPQVRNPAIQELSQLSTPVLSEILRHLDPFNAAVKDPAHGLNLSMGTNQFINASRLNDEFGVRVQHVSVLRAMKALMAARRETGRRLLIPDYEVFIRCAGAASDLGAAKFFWGAIARDGHASERTVQTWTEFIKARYMTESLYYQFDRNRVLLLPRDFPKDLSLRARKELDRIRSNINALMGKPVNRMRGRPHQDNRRMMRYRLGPLSFNAHWDRAKDHGIKPDTEYVTTSMIALERSGAMDLIKAIVLKRGFFMHFDKRRDQLRLRFVKRMHGHSREPDVRLLNAIVETFGSMSLLPLALSTMVEASRFFQISIPHETWSNLLQWAYVCASKTNQRMNKIAGESGKKVTALDVGQLWAVMTSKHFGITPSFDDYTVYVKSLIVRNSFKEAIKLLRTQMIPHYEALVEEHKQAVFDDVLQADAHGQKCEPSHRRIQLETRKEYAWYQIASCLDRLVHVASKTRRRREGVFMNVTLPSLILEFSDFFHERVHYRTKAGFVRLIRPLDEPRFDWYEEKRSTLPMRQPGYNTESGTRANGRFKLPNPKEYPHVPQVKVKQWKRRPRRRDRVVGPAPLSWEGVDAEWWDKVERDLRF